MRLSRLAITLILLISALAVHADEAAEIRERIPRLQGERLLSAYDRLFRLSLEGDDLSYQLRCINDLIAETERQHNMVRTGDARVQKLIFFYNNDLSDSLCQQTPDVLEFLKVCKSWKNYYESWTLLVNTYNFAGETSEALKEANLMFDDAKTRQDKFGMGMAYYVMGNVYSNMYNPEEAANSYAMGIDLLMQVNPLPMQLSDVFSYYADELATQKRYAELEQLTLKWKTFLIEYYKISPEGSDGESDSRWGYYYMACAQAALGQDQLEKAQMLLDEMKGKSAGADVFLDRMWLYYTADLLIRKKDYREALALNDQSVQLAMNSDDKSVMIQTRKQRAEILEGLGRYQEAARLYYEMYAINDSVNSSEVKQQLTEMNARFDNEHLKLQQQEERNRNILIIVSIIIAALLVFIVFRYIAAKRLKAAHVKLEEAHSELETAHSQLLTAYDQLEETTTAKERIESELRIARNIQMGMVPRVFPPFPDRTDIDLFASITPAKAVGGDLYDYFVLDEKLYFCLGDVSGKGVPASLFMAVAVNLFRVASKQQLPPAEIATRMNDVLSENNENSMFVTMFIGVADLKTGHLDFCNAGHNPPVLGGDADGGNFLKMIPNAPIGLWQGIEYEGEVIESIKGKPLFIYTDGLNEAENPQLERFGDEHMLEVLRETHFSNAMQTVEKIKRLVEEHRAGADPNDDLTMMCIKVG